MTERNEGIKITGGSLSSEQIAVGRGAKASKVTYNTAGERQTLAEAAAEIQQLLEQLDKTYSTDTTTEKMRVAAEVVEQIDRSPTLTGRILSALKAGGIQALGQALNHPAASFVIGALEDWQKIKTSQTE